MKLFSASHEPSSPAIAEAQKLLISAIEKLSATVSKATAGNTVFAVITVDEHHSHSRAKRQAEEVSRLRNLFPNYLLINVIVSGHEIQVQPGRFDRQELSSRVQHHVLVRHHLCLLSHCHLAGFEQRRGQRLYHLPHDRGSRQEGQLSLFGTP